MRKSRIKDNRKHTLESFLRSFDRFTIPSFQRKYSWGTRHVAELWNSILTNEPNYYIGTIVGIQNIDPKTGSQTIEIVDGQQRITTLSLFCLALRNFIDDSASKNTIKINDATAKVTYFDNFLSYTDSLRDSSVKNVRLKFTKSSLHHVYSGLVSKVTEIYSTLSSKDEFNELNDTQQVFIKNYRKCLSLIKDHVKDNPKININDLILDIGDRLSKVEFIAIITESDTDTYQLFEGLNSTSMPLSVVDLTKNAVFKTLNSNSISNAAISKAEDLWEQIEEEFDVVNIKWLDSFLRHQWISEYGYINNSELFEGIKKKLKANSSTSALDFLKKIRDDARLYVGLRTFDEKYFGKKFQSESPKIDIRRYRYEIIEKLELISILGLGQIYEVLLALFKKFELTSGYTAKQFYNDVERLWLFSLCATNLPISPSKYEKKFADFSVEMAKYQGKNFNKLSQQFFTELHVQVKNGKQEFVDSIKDTLRFKENSDRKKLIKYIFYIHYGNKFLPDSKHKLRNESIDHIYPKNKNTWKRHHLSEHIHMIGNLALLDSRDNGKLQDLLPGSAYKKKVYQADPFKYNSWISKQFQDFEDDPVAMIEKRTTDIAEDIFNFILEKLH